MRSTCLICLSRYNVFYLSSKDIEDSLSNDDFLHYHQDPNFSEDYVCYTWQDIHIYYKILLLKHGINIFLQLVFQDYIAVKEKFAKFLPHSSGRYAAKRFRKAQCPIVERLVNSLMMHGRNNGKKLMTVRIVKHSFEIIHLLSGEVKILTNSYLVIT